MRLLLDSHTLIWAADEPTRIPAAAMTAMGNPAAVRYVSTATIWELAIKYGRGRLPLSLPYRQWMDRAMADLALTVLQINLDHGERLTQIPFHHRDPFDRLLAAQALAEGIPLVSADEVFDRYGVTRIWQ